MSNEDKHGKLATLKEKSAVHTYRALSPLAHNPENAAASQCSELS